MKSPGVIHKCRKILAVRGTKVVLCGGNHKTRAHEKKIKNSRGVGPGSDGVRVLKPRRGPAPHAMGSSPDAAAVLDPSREIG